MSRLQAEFAASWQRFALDRSRPVLLALSGGMDSMVLAALLLEAGVPFAAAHCNFGLRGDESDGDAQFVQQWAELRHITLHLKTFEITGNPGESIQMAARQLRYAWFEELRQAHRYAAILTAHHGDDLAETVLINLARGTGLQGLAGIPERSGHVLRPLLFADRLSIRGYADAQQVQWREDSSNTTDKYLRNAIRHRVLPVLEELLPGAGRRIAAAGHRVAGSLPLYRTALDKIMKPLIERRGRDFYTPIRLLRKQASLDTVIFELFAPYGFVSDQVASIRALMDAPSGKYLQSATHRLLRDRDFLIITDAKPPEADIITVETPDADVQTRWGRLSFRLRDLPADLASEPGMALLDARSISFPLTIRNRREGDYFYPLGMGGKKKKLTRYLVDVKMPVPEKERLLILEQAGKIIWVVGSRIDERFKVRPDTAQVLEVRFHSGE